MKQGSKIALIAAGIAVAFAYAQKKSISGIGSTKLPADYKRDFVDKQIEHRKNIREILNGK